MLKAILNDTQQLNHKAFFSIIIVPPEPFISDPIIFPHDYLASHVTHVPYGSSLSNTTISRSKAGRKKNYTNSNRLPSSSSSVEKEVIGGGEQKQQEQLLVTENEAIQLRTSNGFITVDQTGVRSKIVHSELLYLKSNTPTHLVLYIDKPIIGCYYPKATAAIVNSNENKGTMVLINNEVQHIFNDSRFIEMMNRKLPNNTANILAKIDRLVLKFCDTSVNCNSLKSLHVCMGKVMDEGYNFIEKVDTSTISDTNLDKIYRAFESYIMELTYDVVFFKITQLLLSQDIKLSKALEDMEYLDFTQIGLPSSIIDARKRVYAAISVFERIGSFRTPAEKLDCLLNTVSELTKNSHNTLDITSNTDAFVNNFLDSDSLIPLLLMTLIRSKVPHLLANLTYMKEYTFERNIVTGKYGYTLSTFEGVLDYILHAHSELSRISSQNVQYWSAIETNDVNQVRKHDNDTHDACDLIGNNSLMIACKFGQADIVRYLLSRDKNYLSLFKTNDSNATPLIYAVKFGKSIDTIKVLLEHYSTDVMDTFDMDGNNALLYAAATNDLNILRLLLLLLLSAKNKKEGQHQSKVVNILTGDNMLHVAAKNNCSKEFIHCIIDIKRSMNLLDFLRQRNNKNETFYHLCQNRELISELLLSESYRDHVISCLANELDNMGRSPLMTWALKGRVDLIELIFSPIITGGRSNIHHKLLPLHPPSIYFARIDKQGRTILHLLALSLRKGLTLGEKSLDFVTEKLKCMTNIRDWSNGNTPLHLAAETPALALAHTVDNTVLFIKSLVRHGAAMSAVNFRNEQPIHLCRTLALATCLDELSIKTEKSFAPIMKQSMYQYSWCVTRTNIRQYQDSRESEIFYVIKSGQIGKPETMQIIQRSLQDFILLHKELLYETPELFLPILENNTLPPVIDLKPPPLVLIDATLSKLQTFMNWLQYHPVLRYHDLVIPFVRSTAELQRSVNRDNSYSRRKLFLEKICDLPIPSSSNAMSSKEEEHFLIYAQEIMMPLKMLYSDMLTKSRYMLHMEEELEREVGLVPQYATVVVERYTPNGPRVLLLDQLAVDTLVMWARMTCNKSYVNPWPDFIKLAQMSCDMIDGISVALQKPLSLIKERNNLRDAIEQQKDGLQSAKAWHVLFSTKDKKKHALEMDKEKVIQSMNKLNIIDRQMHETHRTISDELAHFQNTHPRILVKSIKSMARATLVKERHKLKMLEDTMDQWKRKHINLYNSQQSTCI